MAEALYNEPDIASYYDLENGFDADFRFCVRCAEEAQSVLDLGCGTGFFAACVAPGRRVFGVDPAKPMIDIARWKSAKVNWIVNDARSFRCEEKFDLITLQGHAFQVFLNDEDRAAVLATIKHHLAPGGRFIFDSRNPADRAWENWKPDRIKTIGHPTFGPTKIWTDTVQDDDGIVTYTKHYQREGSTVVWTAPCRLDFPEKDHLEALINASGLQVLNWFGDWHGTPFAPGMPEHVAYGCLASEVS